MDRHRPIGIEANGWPARFSLGSESRGHPVSFVSRLYGDFQIGVQAVFFDTQILFPSVNASAQPLRGHKSWR
jgi:hypothetical protein